MNYLDCCFKINGNLKKISIIEDKTLIHVIRDELGLTGTKLGCGLEQCGSCAILIDGEKKLSCNLLAKNYQNCEITTIEGLENKDGQTEIWLKFYDIFVRHGFGNYGDILREVAYSPMMAQYLTFLNSKSFASSGTTFNNFWQ